MRTLHTLAWITSCATAMAQPGLLDPNFGTNGIAKANVPGTYCSGQALAQQDDGRILVCGQTPGYTLLVRFNEDGSIDQGFGTNGLVTTDVDASNDYIGSIAVQPDGRIVVAGNKFDALANATLIVMRYLSNGMLDNTFSGDGIAELAFPTTDGYGTGLVIQNDGKIAVCGDRYIGPGWESFLTRFNADGTWDGAFGTVQLDMGPNTSDNLRDIALQADGKLVVCGYSLDDVGYGMVVARYNADGSPDAGFGNMGKLRLTPGGGGDERANSVRVQPDGSIVLAGISGDGNDFGVAVVRLLPNGTYDAGFGTNGFVLVPFGASDWTQPSIALQPDGKIVIGADNTASLSADVKVIRLLPNGTLDAAFGSAGIGTSNATPGSDSETAVRTLFLADGGIAVAGFAEGSNPAIQLALWKFQSGLNVGIGEVALGSGRITLAPNPSRGRFVVEGATKWSAATRVVLHDAQGRSVPLHRKISNGRITVEVEEAAGGLYSLSLFDQGRTVTERVVFE